MKPDRNKDAFRMNPEFDMSEWKMGEIAIAAGTKKTD